MVAKKTLADLKKDMPQSSFHEKIAFQKENKNWLDKSFEISLTILDAIDEKGWNQTQLADKLGVSRQRVSKMLKGQENFQLSTLVKLEEVLGVEFIQVDGLNFKSQLENYLLELSKKLVKHTSTVKRQKISFKDSTFANDMLSRVVKKSASDKREDSNKYELAA
ncbi:helix-turn-helix transcriptional regulator [uncultured Roseivirga sp.]|uniref:helix-turn-helix transcriptional regulator n=1 Tax=uncultured Roseivirga sp. TaxID=543088 RepID=UPI000D7A40E3|nr:helix-turn-helix transcriptional regulator [uncultured Roseivirga sp.]PWL29274.1 MAG: hypothetical protein DCO95_12630 [Roseivirga sp. XM-24bin3]